MSTVVQPLPAFNAQAIEACVAHALHLMCQRALAKHPEEAARIQRGYAIAVEGGVHLSGVGLATVQSQRQPETCYTVHSQCTCWDATWAPDGRCKHRWAKALMVQALTYMAQQSEAPDDVLPRPYDFPQWTKYEATYQGPESGGEPVNGIAELLEADLFVFWPEGARTCWHCAYHEVALGPGIEEG
jgi:hypothetical protein